MDTLTKSATAWPVLGPAHTIVQAKPSFTCASSLHSSPPSSRCSRSNCRIDILWGSTLERNQNQQRKFHDIVTRYFNHLMEPLPLILRLTLLLLGSALSLYLWGNDTTVALVVLGVTSFGVPSHISPVPAVIASASCPCGAQILRHFPSLVRTALHPAFTSIANGTHWISRPVAWLGAVRENGFSTVIFIRPLNDIIALPPFLAVDAYALVRTTIRVFVAFAVDGWFRDVRRSYTLSLVLDSQCITWVLQTSLHKSIRPVTPNLLATMVTLADFNTALVPACFDIPAGCVQFVGGELAVVQGSEELVEVSALCYPRTFPYLATMDPTSIVIKDMRRRHIKTFPFEAIFEGSLLVTVLA